MSLVNLTPEASYEYRIRGDMAGSTVYGDVASFLTPPAPEEGGGLFEGLNRTLLIGGAVAATPSVILLLWAWRRRKKRLRA